MKSITTLNLRLAVALRKRDRALVIKLCEQGADPNCNIGITEGQFLSEAVDKTDIEIVELLLEIGANPNKVEDVVSIFTRLLSAMLVQCRCYLDQHVAVYTRFKGGEITGDECGLQQKKLKKYYEKDEHRIVKLKIAKMLIDAGGDINHLLCHPVIAAIEQGISEFRIIIFFLLFCKIDWNLVYRDLPEDLNKAIKIWRHIADCLRSKKNITEAVEKNDIAPLLALKRKDITKILRDLAGVHYSYLEDHDEAYNCQLVRGFSSCFERICSGYALDLPKFTDDSDKFPFLIEPEEFEDNLGKFWIEKCDLVYLWVGEFRLVFEVIAIEQAPDISPYTNRYICQRRDDLHYLN